MIHRAHALSRARMKRKQAAAADTLELAQAGGRRQPQTSCLNCRSKKIKCDRGAPCASCVIRGISCTGQPGAKPAFVPQQNIDESGSGSSILSRLATLERAVFGDIRNASDTVNSQEGISARVKNDIQPSPGASTEFSTVNSDSPLLHHDTERHQAAKYLDSTHTKYDHNITTREHHTQFHIVPASSHRRLGGENARWTESASKPVVIMGREEALLLLRDFCDNPYLFLPIIYEPSTRWLINAFYAQVEKGHEGDPTVAALILSIASTSASFSSHDDHHIFGSIEETDQVSAIWRDQALALLNDTQFSIPSSLERCQARAIIAYVVSNVEGCSVRYRFLHSCTMAVARDMSLHLIDSPVATDKSDDIPTKEIKRRLWWHLATTDWLLSLVGGPLDGTYTVHPRHFVVKRPRNINDSDLVQNETFTYPPHVLTQMSCFLQRIRLAEICREMADARAPGLLGVDITDFDTVSSLDLLFEKALAEMPPPLRMDAPIPPGAPIHLAQQRDVILACFNFRRARLHRPFLLHDTDNPLHEVSRRQCLASARAVLYISSRLLEEPRTIDTEHTFNYPLANRAGLVISAMFTACAILALNAGLLYSRKKGDGDRCSEASKLHSEIATACRVLAKAGEKSVFAANLVRNLVGVLKQYSVKDIDHIVAPSTSSDKVSRDAATVPDDDVASTNLARGRLESISDPLNVLNDFTMWNEFFTTIPEMEHDQFFAGLDYYCGPT